MINAKDAGQLLATVDVRELNTLRWGPLRVMFPRFAEEVELGRFLKRQLKECQCTAIRVESHAEPDGTRSTHIFDLYRQRE